MLIVGGKTWELAFSHCKQCQCTRISKLHATVIAGGCCPPNNQKAEIRHARFINELPSTVSQNINQPTTFRICPHAVKSDALCVQKTRMTAQFDCAALICSANILTRILISFSLQFGLRLVSSNMCGYIYSSSVFIIVNTYASIFWQHASVCFI